MAIRFRRTSKDEPPKPANPSRIAGVVVVFFHPGVIDRRKSSNVGGEGDRVLTQGYSVKVADQ